jgi:hypothetical protein
MSARPHRMPSLAAHRMNYHLRIQRCFQLRIHLRNSWCGVASLAIRTTASEEAHEGERGKGTG